MQTAEDIFEAARHFPFTRSGVNRFIAQCRDVSDEMLVAALHQAVHVENERQCDLLSCAASERELTVPAPLIGTLIRLTRSISQLNPLIAKCEGGAVQELLDVAADPHESPPRRTLAARLAIEHRVPDDEAIHQLMLRQLCLLQCENEDDEFVTMMVSDSWGLLEDVPDEYPLPMISHIPWDKAIPDNESHMTHDAPLRRPVPKVGRNESCPCGSGKKYKRCCFEKDQERLADPSSHAGLTHDEILRNPGLTDDPDIVSELRPARLATLAPKTLADSQLIPAFEQLLPFAFYREALAFLEEAHRRRPHRHFALHWHDLYQLALMAGEWDVAATARAQLTDDDLILPEITTLLEDANQHPEHYAALDRLGRQTVAETDDELDEPDLLPWLAADGLKQLFPGISLLLGRAAVAGAALEDDTANALMTIRHARALIGAPAATLDPAEETAEAWLKSLSSDIEITDHLDHEFELQATASEAQRKQAETRNRLNETRAELERLRRQIAQRESDRVAVDASAETAHAPEQDTTDIDALRRKFQNAKAEISGLQTQRQRLTHQLQREKQRAEKDALSGKNETPGGAPEADTELNHESATFTGRILVPHYSPEFQAACDALPASIAGKALTAVAGFASGSKATWQHTKKLAVPVNHYRIRIGIHYRLILRWLPGEHLEATALLSREELQAWTKRH